MLTSSFGEALLIPMTSPEAIARHYAEQIVPKAPVHTRQDFAHEAVDHREVQLQEASAIILAAADQIAQAQLRVIAAALSFDPAVDRDLETCARRVWHERKAMDQVVSRADTLIDRLKAEAEQNHARLNWLFMNAWATECLQSWRAGGKPIMPLLDQAMARSLIAPSERP